MKKIWLFLLLPLSVFSQTDKKDIEERIKKVENSLTPAVIYGDTVPGLNIEERMKETHIMGLSIAVIRNYQVEWAKGYGWADVAEKRKVNTSTRFQAASISKSLNSMGILKLVQQGKLDPNTDINNYLKTWTFPYDSLSENKKITTYNLLSHTAGLMIHGFPGYERSDTLPTIPQILDGLKPANTKAVRSMYAPGQRHEYSGGGTTISQLLLTSITGRNYAEFMKTEVLTPIGMTNSSYRQPPTDTTVLATGYYEDGKAVIGKYHVYPEQAAAGLWTTPTDLSKYIIECQLTLEGRSQKVLSQTMMEKRMTPYIDSSVGLGVFIVNKNGKKYFSHNGGNEAFLCTYYGSMKDGNGVVIMINGENFSIINELLNSVAIVYDWKGFYSPNFKKSVSVPADTMKQLVGNYLLMNDTLSINFCGTELCILQNGQPSPGFKIHFSDNQLFSVIEVPDATFTVVHDAVGKVEAIDLILRGKTMRMPKMK